MGPTRPRRGISRAAAGFTLVVCLLPLASGAVGAQEWTLDLQGGRVAYEFPESTLDENGMILGMRYRSAASRFGPDWAYLSSGIPFGSGDSFWGATGLGSRIDRRAGPLDLGLDVAGQGYVYRDPTLADVGVGGLLEIRPLLGTGSRRVRVEARSGWVRYGTGIGTESVSRDLHDSDLTLVLGLGRGVSFTGLVRHARADEDAYTYGGARVTAEWDRVRGWGSIGGWTADALSTTAWSAGTSLALGDAGRTRIALSVRRDATDPLYWTAPRSRWSVGISHTFGGRDRVRAPGPDVVHPPSPEVRGGTAVLRLPVTGDGNGPSVAGDFTDWEPVPMVRKDGHWTATFRLRPGVYRYAFRSAGGEWYVPEWIPNRRPDGMGGFVAVLVVS